MAVRSSCRHFLTEATTEDSKEVQTETLELTATPLPSGLVKVKTGSNTTDAVYNAWYNSVYEPTSGGSDDDDEGQG